jgi:hypothetical protein
MRMRTAYLTSTLLLTAIPLSAGAALAPANNQSADGVEQAVPATETCPTGWVWEPDGYMSSGKWRPAHCAPRDAAAP